MSEAEHPSAAGPPPRPRFQFTLRTLLLLFVVAASSLGVFGAWGILVFIFLVGAAIAVYKGISPVEIVVIVVILLLLVALLWPAVQIARESGRRAQCLNNLNQIAKALQAYQQANGHFPPAYLVDNSGKPLLSWRMLILPQLDNSALHTTYNLGEPWDGANNKKPSASRLPIYECPSDPSVWGTAIPLTSYVAVVGTNAAWTGDKPRKLSDFGDDAFSTIMVVEVLHSGIAWAEPKDLSLDQLGGDQTEQPALVVSSNHSMLKEFFYADPPVGFNAILGDGSVRYIPLESRSPDDLRKLLEIGGLRNEANGLIARRLNWPNIATLAVWLVSVGALLTAAVRGRKRRWETP
jgi:type II secretory pathway pseudopilin PulG